MVGGMMSSSARIASIHWTEKDPKTSMPPADSFGTSCRKKGEL
jgi:hypothetical protein